MQPENAEPEFAFPPNTGDTQPLKAPSGETPLTALEQASREDPGFNPYDTGVHRAMAFATKVRDKKLAR